MPIGLQLYISQQSMFAFTPKIVWGPGVGTGPARFMAWEDTWGAHRMLILHLVIEFHNIDELIL